MQKLLIIICSFLFSSLAFAVQVSSSAVPSALHPDDMLTFIVTVEYESAEDIRKPRLPNLGIFDLLSQSSSSEFSMINGKVKRKKSYIYTLRPRQEGEFVLNSAEMIIDGRKYKTKPIKIRVSSKIKIKPKSQQPSSPFGGGIRKFFQNPFPQNPFFQNPNTFQPQKQPTKEDMFIHLETNARDQVYLGEMILAKWFFCLIQGRATFNANIEVTEYADTNGFWQESVSPVGAPTPSGTINKGGRPFQKQLILSSALFPIRLGKLKISPLEARIQIMNLSAFSRSPRIFTEKSLIKQIHVKPLPEKGKDASFTEAVGDFSISANVNKRVVSVNESLIYTITFEGQGHPRLIQLPKLNFGKDVEIYDISDAQEFSFKKSRKAFSIILIPKTSGRLQIPPFELTTFDPELGIYKTHILPTFELQVSGNQKKTTSPDQDKRYFESNKDQKASLPTVKKEAQKNHPLTALLSKEEVSGLKAQKRQKILGLIYGFFLFLLALILRKLLFFKKPDSTTLKARLQGHLKALDAAIKKENWKQAGVELNQLLQTFFAEFSEGAIHKPIGQNWEALIQNLQPSIRIKYESRIRQIVSRVELLSFASEELAQALRNKQSVEELKKASLDLVQEIGT